MEENWIPNIPENVWSAAVDLMRQYPWTPSDKVTSRIEALVDFCNWYFETHSESQI